MQAGRGLTWVWGGCVWVCKKNTKPQRHRITVLSGHHLHCSAWCGSSSRARVARHPVGAAIGKRCQLSHPQNGRLQNWMHRHRETVKCHEQRHQLEMTKTRYGHPVIQQTRLVWTNAPCASSMLFSSDAMCSIATGIAETVGYPLHSVAPPGHQGHPAGWLPPATKIACHIASPQAQRINSRPPAPAGIGMPLKRSFSYPTHCHMQQKRVQSSPHNITRRGSLSKT